MLLCSYVFIQNKPQNFTQPKIRKIEKNNIIFAVLSYPVSAELISNYKKNA